MKKIWMMMAMVAIFTACSNEEEFDSQVGNYTLTGYANVESRTAFGTPGDSSIPFAWSANDYIYAGSAKSYTIANGGISATFNFSSNPSGDVYYNIAGSSATEAHVKAEQTAGDLGANGDFGYGTISNGSFTLNHATAYLWFNITTLPEGATLQSITFDAGAATIAGKATWDGSKFGSISDGSNSIQLNVNKATVSGAETAMVVYPAVVESASVTYQLSVGGTTKYYKQLLGAKTFTKGTTYKISVNLDTEDLYELRVLTFEDEDAKFEEYMFYNGYGDEEYIETWSQLIPENQWYNGSPLIYNMGEDAEYEWHDANNTELHHLFPLNYGIRNYAGGGMAVSSHTVPFEDLEEYTIYDYQVSVTAQSGHNGSRNFCVAYNCSEVNYDAAGLEKNTLSFGDEVARVIDHMYVMIAAPTHYCITYGNSFSSAFGDDDFLKIVATGIKEDGTKTEPIEIMLAEGADMKLTEWTKWDLSGLGKIKAVEFHMEEAQFDTYGNASYWRTPMYFAFDDVAVRFE